MMHAEDGSAWEVALASSQQNKHTELTPGAPGLGKSVLINALSEIQIASAQKNSFAFHCLYRQRIRKVHGDWYSLSVTACLSRERTKPWGSFWSNDPDHHNLFDVMYGARKPVTPEKNFGLRPLCIVCGYRHRSVPVIPATPGKSSAARWTAFREYGENNPRLYRRRYGNPLVDLATGRERHR